MITYNPLWETLKNRNITQYKLIKEFGVSTGTLDALRKNRSVSTNTLNQLCSILNCSLSDIAEFQPDSNLK